MTSLNPDFELESWKDILDFIIQFYFGGSKLLFFICLILAIVFMFFIYFYILPSFGVRMC